FNRKARVRSAARWVRKDHDGGRMDATGLSRGGSRSPLQTGQKHYSWPSVAWNVTDHGTSPWHLHPAKPLFKMCSGSANVSGHQSSVRERLRDTEPGYTYNQVSRSWLKYLMMISGKEP
ncbi:MAG: hypothetical protein R6U98_15455, partial [Pirellulaceae bacterium]